MLYHNTLMEFTSKVNGKEPLFLLNLKKAAYFSDGEFTYEMNSLKGLLKRNPVSIESNKKHRIFNKNKLRSLPCIN